MSVLLKQLSLSCMSIAVLAFLPACGGGSSSGGTTPPAPPPPPPPPPPPAALTLPATIGGQDIGSTALSFNEGETITLSIDPRNSGAISATLAQTSGTEIDFGNFTVGGLTAGNNLIVSGGAFTLSLTDQEGNRTATFDGGPLLIDVPLPAVNADTAANLAFSYTDGTTTNNETISFTIADSAAATAVTISGVVAKGLVSNARVILTNATQELPDRVSQYVPLGEDVTDAEGRYTITIDASANPDDMLGITTILEGANMVCDALSCGPNIGFGDTFTIIDGVATYDVGNGLEDFDLLLSSVIPMPSGGTASDINVNAFTHLSINRMIGFSMTDGSVGPNGGAILRSQDLAPAQSWIANAFGLDNQDFTQLPFVDITQPITETSQQAIRAALIAGGFMQAVSVQGQTNGLDFAELFFSNQLPFIGQSLWARQENAVGFPFITLQDIFVGADTVAGASATNGSSGTAFDAAQQFVQDRLTTINSAPPNVPVGPDGNLPAVFTDLAFFSDSRTFSTSNTGAALTIVNPDNLAYTAMIEPGTGSSFFTVGSTTSPQNMDINFNNVPAGTYNLSVTFDTAEGEPNTDSIELIFSDPEIGVVEESVTISKAATDRAILNYVNPDNFQITNVEVSGTGSEFFFIGGVNTGSFELLLDAITPPPNGTYNLTFDIDSSTVGASGTDTVEVIITP